jgi:3-deoxy-D-manno-octulosonic-acid transferase
MRYLYTLLLSISLPLVLLRLLWRSRRAPAYRQRWGERLGAVGGDVQPGGLWIHAVSVGEAQAVAPLVRALLLEHPKLPITVTTTTPTGAAQVERLFGQAVKHSYMPYDLPFSIGRFLDRVQPCCFVMVETEVWPNLLAKCRARGVATLLANARLSARSLRRYRVVGRFARQVFADIGRIAAQSDEDALRFQSLGVPPERISVTGSIKFDVEIPASVEEQVEVMRRGWSGRPVWIAASTHEGEEEIVLAAHARVLRQVPEALLLLVPRHPERFEKVTMLIMRNRFKLVRRSDGNLPEPGVPVYLGDTMGELPVMLGSADVAFVGGSLTEVGGHNMLEAAAQGVPVCFGPHVFNFALIAEMLLECGAARQVADAEQLSARVIEWLNDASCRSNAGEAGRRMVMGNRGALARLRAIVDELLGAA